MSIKEIAQRMMDLFASGQQAHGEFIPAKQANGEQKISGDCKTLATPPTLDMWIAHLTGTVGLGCVPIESTTDTCYWGVIDLDQYPMNFEELEKKLKQATEITYVICQSKSGGAHIFIFFSEPVPAQLVQAKLKNIAAAIGHPKAEIFPKQIVLEQGEHGNWLNMPYFGSTRKCYHEGEWLGRTAFLDFAESRRMSMANLMDMEISKVKASRKKSDKKTTIAPTHDREVQVIRVKDIDWSEGPPCQEQIINEGGLGKGERNTGLFGFGVQFRKRFDSKEDWSHALEKFNYNEDWVHAPLPAQELKAIIRSVAKKDYQYPCKHEPFCSHCDKQLCLTRKYGIRNPAGMSSLELSNLRKINTDPPRWVINVNGIDMTMDTAELMEQRRFAKRCMEVIHKFPATVRTDEWRSRIEELLDDVTELPAPDDAGIVGQFRILVQAYMHQRAQGEAKEELLQGKPWHDIESQRVYFKSHEIIAFLRRNNFSSYSVSQVYTQIEAMGGASKTLNVGGTSMTCWFLPMDTANPQSKKNEETLNETSTAHPTH